MNQHEAMRRMRAPMDRKPEIWRQGVIQIHLGTPCDLACTGCTQGSQFKLNRRASTWMTPEQFETCVQALLEPVRFWGVVGVFGGNPVLSPHFEACCEILQSLVPKDQCGLWSNHPHGKGAVARATFAPEHSNLNVHTVQEARDEFVRDWPECEPYLKGLDLGKPLRGDSRHSPPWVAMGDLQDLTDAERWRLVSTCDVNRLWSPMFYVMRGEVRFSFCELAAAQAMLHQHEPDYPDLGRPVTPGVWHQPLAAFADQVRHHCMSCGHPLRFPGDFAHTGRREYVSPRHLAIANAKRKDRDVVIVTHKAQLVGAVDLATNYIQNTDLAIGPPKRIDCLTTSVGPYYAGLLRRTLPTWLAEADTVTVVTMPNDPALAVCADLASPKLHVVTTPVFREHGAAFNKFAALSVAYQSLPFALDWLIHFDADTAAEKGWRAKAESRLEPGWLGGVHRYDERGRKIADHPFGCGFVHAWHVSDPQAQQRPLWEPWWGHAGHGDRNFLERWNAQKRIRDLGFRVTHLGEPRANWFGPENPDNARRMAELHEIGLGEARFVEQPLALPAPWVASYEFNGKPGEAVLVEAKGEAAA